MMVARVVLPRPGDRREGRGRGLRRGFCGFKRDGELLFGFGLADEFPGAAGAELELERIFVFGAGGGDEALGVFGVRFGSGGMLR